MVLIHTYSINTVEIQLLSVLFIYHKYFSIYLKLKYCKKLTNKRRKRKEKNFFEKTGRKPKNKWLDTIENDMRAVGMCVGNVEY
jgi:hypothetical protein